MSFAVFVKILGNNVRFHLVPPTFHGLGQELDEMSPFCACGEVVRAGPQDSACLPESSPSRLQDLW